MSRISVADKRQNGMIIRRYRNFYLSPVLGLFVFFNDFTADFKLFFYKTAFFLFRKISSFIVQTGNKFIRFAPVRIHPAEIEPYLQIPEIFNLEIAQGFSYFGGGSLSSAFFKKLQISVIRKNHIFPVRHKKVHQYKNFLFIAEQ